MSEDFILVEDNVFSKKECENIITKYSNKTTKAKKEMLDYFFLTVSLNDFGYEDKINKVLNSYKNKFEEINKTSSLWCLGDLRFKHFKPGHSFNKWHSEHCLTYPNRVLSLQIYLSEHDCGTEFYNGKVIKSKIGRVTIFPSYFTHTHRGQVCPDKKDRYIITGYYNFNKKGKYE